MTRSSGLEISSLVDVQRPLLVNALSFGRRKISLGTNLMYSEATAALKIN